LTINLYFVKFRKGGWRNGYAIIDESVRWNWNCIW